MSGGVTVSVSNTFAGERQPETAASLRLNDNVLPSTSSDEHMLHGTLNEIDAERCMSHDNCCNPSTADTVYEV